MGVPSGGNLGAARGSITIDTSQAQQSVAVMRGVAVGIQNVMGNVTVNINKAQKSVDSLSGSLNQMLGPLRQLAGAFGVSLGVQTVMQIGRAAVGAVELATAYERQGIAAVNLAGSQGRLNELLKVYDKATGGAVDQVTALQNVTKLMAVGFGDSSEELEQFARAIRGISLAMGMSQDTVTQNLILELFTQRGMRLDQLGLQYDRVRQRADELQAADRNLTQQMAYQQAVLEQAEKRFGKLADSQAGAATKTELLQKAWANLRLEMAQEIKPNIEEASNALTDLLGLIDRIRDSHANLTREATSRRAAEEGRYDPFGPLASRTTIGRIRPENLGGGGDSPAAAVIEGVAEAKIEWARGIREINDQLHDDIIDAENDYGRQRADAIRNYQKGVAREERDFNRMRLRANLDFLDSIADVYRDASRRESKAATDLARTIGEMREDSNERVTELEEDYQRDREKRARAHRDNILEAAGRLDAKAISEANRNFKRQEQDAKEAHDKQREEAKEGLQERIDDANEAHQRQLEDARAADAERLADMKADFAKRQAQEDEDRAIRNSDRAQDHSDQLIEMDRAHGERLKQINEQAAKELKQHNENHEAEMARLNAADEAMRKRVEARDKLLLDSWEKFWKKVQDDLNEANSTTPRTMPGGPVKAFAEGGFVPRDMLARLHAGEVVIPASQVAAGGIGGNSLSVGSINPTIVIGDTGGRSDAHILALVRQGIVDALTEIAA